MNKHLILIKFVGPSITLSARVKLVSQRFPKDTLTLGYDHELNGTFDNGMALLKKLGYTVCCSGEMNGCYWAAVNQFSPIKEQWADYKRAQKKDKATA